MLLIMHSFQTYFSVFHLTKQKDWGPRPPSGDGCSVPVQPSVLLGHPQLPSQSYGQDQPLGLSRAGEVACSSTGTHRCTRGCGTPGSQPRALCTRSRREPPPCTAGCAAGCRWSRSPSTGSTSSTPATVRRLHGGHKRDGHSRVTTWAGQGPMAPFWGRAVQLRPECKPSDRS